MQNRVHELFAYLRVSNATEAIRFYAEAFGATEKFRLTEPSGRVGHAELNFGEGITLMVSDAYPELGLDAPRGESAVSIHLHVDNADEMIERALRAGATLERAAEDHFYGERSGAVRDPFGHRWLIGHSIEDVTPEQMQSRYTALMNEG
jgi:uncharacterized glyoxalase superfamily protein PhnB